MLIIQLCLSIVSATIPYLDDNNFQKRTLIAKHIPIQNWIIGFCKGQCEELNDEIIENYQVAFVNVNENEWISNNFQLGYWAFHTNSTMCQITSKLPQIICSEHQIIPQIYNYPKYEFFSLKLLAVHIGLIILVIFYYMVIKDLWQHFKGKQQKLD